MINFAAFQALIPTFLAEWSITNAEAGWISGAYFAGYVAAGEAAAVADWRLPVVIAAAAFGVAFAPIWFGVPSLRPAPPAGSSNALDFLPVLRNCSVMAYIWGYAAITGSCSRSARGWWRFWSTPSRATPAWAAGDSAALTSRTVAAAEPGRRGATLAVHASLGFVGGIFGPLAVGVALDLAGPGTTLAWGLGFLAVGFGSAVTFLAILKR